MPYGRKRRTTKSSYRRAAPKKTYKRKTRVRRDAPKRAARAQTIRIEIVQPPQQTSPLTAGGPAIAATSKPSKAKAKF